MGCDHAIRMEEPILEPIVELHGPLRNGAEKKGSYGGVSPGWNTARNFVITPQQYLKPSFMRLYSKLSGCYNWIHRKPRRS